MLASPPPPPFIDVHAGRFNIGSVTIFNVFGHPCIPVNLPRFNVVPMPGCDIDPKCAKVLALELGYLGQLTELNLSGKSYKGGGVVVGMAVVMRVWQLAQLYLNSEWYNGEEVVMVVW